MNVVLKLSIIPLYFPIYYKLCSCTRDEYKPTLNTGLNALKEVIRTVRCIRWRKLTHLMFRESQLLRLFKVIQFVTCNYVYESFINCFPSKFWYHQYGRYTRESANCFYVLFLVWSWITVDRLYFILDLPFITNYQ